MVATRFGVCQRLPFFFRPPAFGHVDDGSHEFHEIAGFADNALTYYIDVFDFSIGHKQSMSNVKIPPFLRYAIDCLLNAGFVKRMGPFKHETYGRLNGPVAFENAKGFLRPVKFPAGNIPAKTARVAQPLRFGTEIDQLLLSVAANHAATAFRMARVVRRA